MANLLSTAITGTLSTTSNVGIGTTSPNARLTVVANDSSNPNVALRLSSTAYSGVSYPYTSIRFGSAYSSYPSWNLASIDAGYTGASWGGSLLFYTNNDSSETNLTERMRITSAGNVGIGTTNPDDKFVVAGVIKSIGGTANGKYAQIFVNDSYAYYTTNSSIIYMNKELQISGGFIGSYDGDLSLRTSGTTRIRVENSTGNVGIGTTSPFARLQINSGNIGVYNNISTDGAQLYLGDTNFSNSSYWNSAPGIGAVYAPGTSVAGDLAFYVYTGAASSRTERMRIVTGGNVGIGTTSPAYKLDIGSNTSETIRISATATSGSTANLLFGSNIITSQAAKIQGIYGGSWDGALAFFTQDAGAADGNRMTEKVRILSNGNVGIGTTNTDPLSLSRERNLAIVTTGTNAALTIVGGAAGRIDFGVGSTRTGGIYSDSSNYTEIFTTTALPLVFSTNSAEKMRINSAGNVGIGTTSPAVTLDVVANSGGNALSLRMRPTNNDYSFIQGRSNDGTEVIGEIAFNRTAASTGNMLFYTGNGTNSTEKLRITSAGNIGIGTTSPSYRLSINDSAGIEANEEYFYFHSNYSVGSNARAKIRGVGAGGGSGYGGDFRISTRATNNTWNEDAVTVNYAGNVGIGTASPAYTLDVSGTARTTTGTYLGTSSGNVIVGGTTSDLIGGFKFIAIGNTAIQYAASTGTYLRIEPGAADTQVALKADARSGAYPPMAFHTSDTERMRITSAGNVGIGTTGPTSLLHISGIPQATSGSMITIRDNDANGSNTSFSGVFFSSSPGTDYSIGKLSSGSDGLFQIRNGNNGTGYLTINNSGNVGIGTSSPQRKLHVVDTAAQLRVSYDSATDARYSELSWGGLITYAGNTNNGMTIGMDGGNSTFGHIYFYTGPSGSSTEKMRITQGGNVGIGTTSPQSRLDLGVASSQSTISTLGYSANAALNIRIPNSVGDVGQIVFTNDAAPTAGYASIGVVMTSGTGVGLGDIVFATKSVGSDAASTERMRINSSGNVGIGVTSIDMGLQIGDGKGLLVGPSSSSGSMYVSPTDENTINGSWGIAEDTADIWLNYRGYRDGFDYFRDTRIGNGKGTAIVMVDGSAGNVGIGTTSPATNLHVYSTQQKDTIGHIQYENANTGTGAATNAQLIGKSKYGTLQYMVWESNGARIGMRSTANSGSGNLYFTVGTDSVSTTMLANGNVGIGTTSPNNKLVVSGSFRTILDGTYNQGILNEYVSTYVTRTKFGRPDTVSNLELYYDIQGTEEARITRNYTTAKLKFDRGATTDMIIDGSGNVGIGTTSPVGKLDVALLNTRRFIVTYDDSLVTIKGANNTGAGENLRIIGDNLIFNTSSAGSGSERMRITSGGNVGIATTSPTHKLNVYDDVTNQYTIRVQSETGNGAGKWMGIGFSGESANNKGAILFQSYGTSYSRGRMIFALNNAEDQTSATPSNAIMSLEANGRVGIGTTSPSYKLDIATANDDAIRITNSLGSNNNGLALAVGSGTPWMDFAGSSFSIKYNTSLGSWNSGANAHFTILSGGNVGIGTTSPSDKLDVSGNARTSGYVLVNNHSDNTLGYRISNTSGTAVSAMFVNSSNQLVIAAGAVDQVNLNKKVLVNGVALGVNVAPSATAGRIDASNDIVAYSSSDERLKQNITPIENALDKVKSLTGVEFDWKPEYKDAHGYEGHDTGIIAQQVEAVMPSAVRTNDTGFLAVRYEKLIGLLIEANKELAARVEELEKKIG